MINSLPLTNQHQIAQIDQQTHPLANDKDRIPAIKGVDQKNASSDEAEVPETTGI